MKPTIVYVDDEEANLVVFEMAFSQQFDVHCATSGEEALQLLEQMTVAVLVADHRMPGMTGVELCEIVARKYPYTKRVILTAYSDANAMLQAINKGRVFYYLTKPWNRSTLHTVLNQAVEAYELALANAALSERLVTSQRFAALGKAAAEIAHEMGNQMGMLPLIEMIEERSAGDVELCTMARFARQTSERLASLVEEIKAFVRCDHLQVERNPLRLTDVVHELMMFLRFDASVPRERICVQIRAEPVVAGNKAKLQQVLLNLLKNAADAIRGRADGRIEISVDAAQEEAVVTVSDNGCGMTADVQARIWEPFFTTKADQGTGLGLDVSRQIIESHQGSITCQSQPQHGAAFVIRLPLVPAPPPDCQSSPPGASDARAVLSPVTAPLAPVAAAAG